VESDGFVHHFDLRGEHLLPTSFPLCTLPPSVAIAARSSPSEVESVNWIFLYVRTFCIPVKAGTVKEKVLVADFHFRKCVLTDHGLQAALFAAGHHPRGNGMQSVFDRVT
jgi:hypothetical protein